MWFFPLRRFHNIGQQLFPSDNHPLGCAFSVFHTLSRLSSAQCLLAIFHARPVLGVHPSGSVSTHRAISSLELLSPLVVGSYPGHHFSSLFHSELPRSDLTAFKKAFMKQRFALPAPLQGFFPCECLYLCTNNESRTKTITLLGFLLLRVLSLSASRSS